MTFPGMKKIIQVLLPWEPTSRKRSWVWESFKAFSAHSNTVNAILPNALQPLCGCPPCGWHQLAPVHCWWAAPWKHRGSRAESHTSVWPQSRVSPTETDHQKHSASVTNQTVYYSHFIWQVCWSAAVYLEVWLVEYAWQLGGGVAAVCKGAQLSQDVLHQLHIIVPHGLQSCLLQTLCTLEDQSGFKSHTDYQLLVCRERMAILLLMLLTTSARFILFVFRYI